MQRLPRKLNGTQRIGPISIPRLSYQRVPMKPGLQSNLIPAASPQPDLDKRRAAQPFDHPIVTPGFLTFGVARMRFLLNELLLIPDKSIGPRSGRRCRMTADHREVHALRFTAPKLILQLR